MLISCSLAKGTSLRNLNDIDIACYISCLLYTSDAADERSSVDLGGRRIIKKKKKESLLCGRLYKQKELKRVTCIYIETNIVNINNDI